MFTADDRTPTDSWFTANIQQIHPSGDCWMMDVSPESGNTCDSYGIKNRKSERPTSASNKTHGQKERCHSVEGVQRQKIFGEKLNRKWKKFPWTRQKRYISGIPRQVLKAFTKRIGYRNFGAHSSIREIFDYIIESKLVCRACTELQGSKFLQHQIIHCNWADRLDILDQVVEKLISICKQKYGNLVVQCFFELGNPSVEREILLRMKNSLCDIAMSEYGSWVLQRAILSTNNELLQIVSDVIVPHAYMLALDNFGHHVLQRIIEHGSGAIVHALLVNVIGRRRNSRLIQLSKDVYGCRFIQRMLENTSPVDRGVIINTILGSTRAFFAVCKHQYGNYVVQHILSHFGEQYSMVVMDLLECKLSKMAKKQVLLKCFGSAIQTWW
eukprot:TRINITY_DN46_c0_g1_i14.p1 TRINITY_DN46_c0_g1~~TRINITY_DN46_c0_g1_i14.p1  ORF type:complete len:410 (-),score=87.11 TRINITY_DN46_c0_g1_i14:208-1359(-)